MDSAERGIKMTEQTKPNKTVWLLIAIVGGVITAGAVLAIVNKRSTEPEYVRQTVTTEETVKIEQSVEVQQSENVEQARAAATKTLEDIIKSAQSWDPAFKPWFGKAAPDFTVRDIESTEHSLSSYLGKDVLVVFWATWCPACNLEIPHLIELRKEIGEDDLAIIAISNEEPERLKQFTAVKGINYTVAALGNSVLPSPFLGVSSIPTTFFIDQKGQIKLAALGLVTLEETKAILKAEQ